MPMKLKTLSPAFIAIAVLAVMTAPAAQGAELDIGANPAALTGHSPGFQLSISKTAGGKIFGACTTSTFEGTAQQGQGQAQAINETTITPTIGSCIFFKKN